MPERIYNGSIAKWEKRGEARGKKPDGKKP
jgi:hypothetical protein